MRKSVKKQIFGNNFLQRGVFMTKIFGWDEQETKSFLEFVFQNKDKTYKECK